MKKYFIYISIILLISYILCPQDAFARHYQYEVFGNSGFITSEGAKFHLTNGITIEIPPNSIEKTGEISFTFPKEKSNIDKSKKTFKVNSKSIIRNMIVTVPVDSKTTIINISALCYFYETFMEHLLYHSFYPKGILLDSKCIYILNANDISYLFSNPTLKSISSSPSIYPDLGTLDSALFIFEELSDNDPAILKCASNVQKHIKNNDWPIIKWPFYKRYFKADWASSWLMLLKGFRKDLPDDFSTVYRILHYTKMPSDDNPRLYNIINAIYGYDDIKSFYFPLKTKETISQISSNLIGTKMIANHYFEKSFVANVVNQLEQGNPVMTNFFRHSVILLGYKYEGTEECNINNIINNISFIFHDPGFARQENGIPYCVRSFNYIKSSVDYDYNHGDFIIHYFSQPPKHDQISLDTIHLSYVNCIQTPVPVGEESFGTIIFKQGEKYVCWTTWDTWKIEDYYPITLIGGFNLAQWNGKNFLRTLNPEAYKWVNIKNSEITEFDNIEFRSFDIYNTTKLSGECIITKPNIAISFYPFQQNVLGNELAQIKTHGIFNSNFGGYDFQALTTKDSNENSINIGKKFKDNIKEKTDFLMRIALIAENASKEIDLINPQNYLDKIDIKFTYVPSKN